MNPVQSSAEPSARDETQSRRDESAPNNQHRLSGFDLGVLWGDLSIGVLVLLSGALLVPALGLPQAALAIVVGSVVGCIPLALVALAGQRSGVPTMTLLRTVLGRRGSYLPSVLNIAQLVGWTGFEFWVMSSIAARMSAQLPGFSSYWLWLGVVAIICTTLALCGPILVIRKWLERFGAWGIGAVGGWITVRLLMTPNLAMLWSRPGTGGMPFWVGVDLVISQPVSWLPLVADYSRFARSPRAAAGGTYWGYVAGNIWFYLLGALLVLAAGLSEATPVGLAQAVAALAGGWIVMLTLLVGETDEAFADIYSAAVSSFNLSGRIPRRGAIVAASAGGVALAAWLGLRPDTGIAAFESFLFLLGSVFVPLFGVFVGDHFLLRRDARVKQRSSGARGTSGIRGAALVAWGVGFLVYQWSVPTGPATWQGVMGTVFREWLHLPYPLAGSAMGASIPSFVCALGVYMLVSWRPFKLTE
jgi:nucleobase:cation symporter-1, NCS1 family